MENLPIYQSYGKFAIEFETLLNRILIAIIFAFSRFGMKNQDLTRVLLTDLTAYPLITKYQSIITIIYEKEPKTLIHIEPLFKFLKNITEERNEIIHGQHKIHNNSINELTTTRVKFKISKKGYDIKVKEIEPQHYDELTKKLQIANHIVGQIQMCIDLNEKILDCVKTEKLESLK